MPRLYCEPHGREHEARVIGNQAIYRQEGESVLIASGTLKLGPWHCDQCNALLRRGDIGYLLSAYPRWIAETMHDYDFAQEREYFTRKGRLSIGLYGAGWPGSFAAAMPRMIR